MFSENTILNYLTRISVDTCPYLLHLGRDRLFNNPDWYWHKQKLDQVCTYYETEDYLLRIMIILKCYILGSVNATYHDYSIYVRIFWT